MIDEHDLKVEPGDAMHAENASFAVSDEKKQTTDPATETKTGFRKQRTYSPNSSTAKFDMREHGRKSTPDFSNAKVYLKSQNRPTRGKSFHISEKN